MKKTSETKAPSLIGSFTEACQIKGYDVATILPDLSSFPEKHRASLTAQAKLIIIAEVLNEGWEPDWNNDNEYKYFPYFWMDSPGFRFRAAIFSYSLSSALGGSRLCFRTRKLAKYAGETFLELYRDLMTLPKK